MVSQMTSRQFNQDTSGAKRAAEDGPVYITSRGRPAHVLLTFEAYDALVAPHGILDMLAAPIGDDAELDIPAFDDLPVPAPFD